MRRHSNFYAIVVSTKHFSSYGAVQVNTYTGPLLSAWLLYL